MKLETDGLRVAAHRYGKGTVQNLDDLLTCIREQQAALKDLAGAVPDFIHQANRAGCEFDTDAELFDARAVLTKYALEKS